MLVITDSFFFNKKLVCAFRRVIQKHKTKNNKHYSVTNNPVAENQVNDSYMRSVANDVMATALHNH